MPAFMVHCVPTYVFLSNVIPISNFRHFFVFRKFAPSWKIQKNYMKAVLICDLSFEKTIDDTFVDIGEVGEAS